MRLLLTSVVAGGALLATAAVGHAGLLAYEGFDYPVGAVHGQNGGTGWLPGSNGDWDNQSAGSDYTVASGSALSFGSLATTGLGMSGGGNFRSVG